MSHYTESGEPMLASCIMMHCRCFWACTGVRASRLARLLAHQGCQGAGVGAAGESRVLVPQGVTAVGTPGCHGCWHPRVSWVLAPQSVTAVGTLGRHGCWHPMVSRLLAPYGVTGVGTPGCHGCRHHMDVAGGRCSWVPGDKVGVWAM